HGIEGKPADALLSVLGSSIKGFSALGFKALFVDIKNTLDHVIAQYQSSSYKNIWPELDYITQLNDQTTIDHLHTLLNAKLITVQAKAILLSAPNLKNPDAGIASSYWIGRIRAITNGGIVTSPSLYIGAWLNLCSQKKQIPTAFIAKKTPVHMFDESSNEIGLTNIYNCVCDEEGHNGKQYILSGGIWYEIELNFIKETNRVITKILTSQFPIDKWDGIDDEGIYNKKCCDTNNRLLCMDAKNIHYGGGQSKFEFCDIWDPHNNIIYFVKNITSSSQFSHLAEQIRRTVELLFSSDQHFRDELIKKINTHHKTANTTWLKQRSTPGSIKLCMVSMGKHYNSFPFFAKCSLAKLIKELGTNGHELEYFQA
ncbi:MAG: TIGR04141 family sporadically distributed protein, partial [Bacteroidia bacterium]|nr:TIGR04141 family sporadically distributed protein [Methylotenera sp.]